MGRFHHERVSIGALSRSSTVRLVVLCSIWFAAFALTPGLLDHGRGSLVTNDPAGVILVESCLASALIAVVLLLGRSQARRLLRRSRRVWAYAVPALLLLVLPLHYFLDLPLALYAFWTAASVFWQDYLTFGLLQSRIAARLPAAATIGVVAAASACAHAVLIPQRFAPPAVLPLLAILLLGAVLAGIRAGTGDLHLLLAGHLAFYYAFA